MLVVTIILFSVLNMLGASNSSETDNELLSRILYGSRANISHFPFFAALPDCGATIISDRWLITAGHCVSNKKGQVWVGGDSIQSSQRYTFDQAVIHPGYKSIVYGIPVNDVALLRLSRTLTFSSTVKAAALPEQEYERNTVHAFAGKGRDESGSGTMTKYLMTMNVRTLKEHECLSYLPSWQRAHLNSYLDLIKKVTICTRRIEDKPGLCFGDSGSPLVREKTLVGIASFISDSNCYNAKLGMFVNVAPFVDWIKSVTGLK